MKKLLTYLLTFAMVITIIIPAMKPALAEDNVPVPVAVESASTQTKDVLANVTAPAIADVFYVELTWGSMRFNIEDNGTRSYNPETMEDVYNPEVTVTPAEQGADEFQIKNNSNFKVQAATTITDNTGGQLRGTFSGGGTTNRESGTLIMKARDKNNYIHTVNFAATDSFKMAGATDVKIATVSVALSKSTI